MTDDETVLMVGTRKGLWIGRSAAARARHADGVTIA